MNAAMMAAITAALVPYATLTAKPVGCCGGAVQSEQASLLLDMMASMHHSLGLSDEDIGYYAANVGTPHIRAGVPLDISFWDLARQTKAVTQAEVRRCVLESEQSTAL